MKLSVMTVMASLLCGGCSNVPDNECVPASDVIVIIVDGSPYPDASNPTNKLHITR